MSVPLKKFDWNNYKQVRAKLAQLKQEGEARPQVPMRQPAPVESHAHVGMS